MSQEIRFDDGAAYEQFMGKWSRIAGESFLSWLAPAAGQAWLDVGCGNGAFTELIVEQCAPATVLGIDPSEGQLAHARNRLVESRASFQCGDAMALPFDDGQFDLAVMGLVIFFVIEPAKAVSEMSRVVRPNGIVASYAWDVLEGGFPAEPIYVELREMGISPPLPPSAAAAGIEESRTLWRKAGLEAVETRQIELQRTFPTFDEFWSTCLRGPGIGPIFKQLASDRLELLRTKVAARIKADEKGPATCLARANAIRGRVPG